MKFNVDERLDSRACIRNAAPRRRYSEDPMRFEDRGGPKWTPKLETRANYRIASCFDVRPAGRPAGGDERKKADATQSNNLPSLERAPSAERIGGAEAVGAGLVLGTVLHLHALYLRAKQTHNKTGAIGQKVNFCHYSISIK